jgi:hypothetical protein
MKNNGSKSKQEISANQIYGLNGGNSKEEAINFSLYSESNRDSSIESHGEPRGIFDERETKRIL